MSEAVIESCGMHKKSTNGICLYTSGWCEGYQKSKCDDSPCDECADCRYNQFHEVQKIREDSGIEENISIRMMYQEIEDLTEELTRLKELNREMVEIIKLHCDQCKIEQMITEDVCSVIECSFYKVLKKARGEGE